MRLNIRNTTVDVSKSLKDIYTPCTFSVWASLDNTVSSEVNKSITPYEDSKYFLGGASDVRCDASHIFCFSLPVHVCRDLKLIVF